MKVDLVDEFDSPLDITKEVTKVYHKDEWHPRYEWAGVWARGFIKQYIKVLIVYGIWGAVLGFTYHYGGYSGLAISGIVAIIYTLRNGFDQLIKKR